MLSTLPQASRLVNGPTTPCKRSARLIARASDKDSVASRIVSTVTAASVALSSLLGGTLSTAVAGATPLHLTAEQQYEQQVERLHHTAPAARATPLALAAEQQYEQQVQRLHHKQPLSNLPSADEAAALQMLMDPDLFTPEAWQGMLRLQQYAQYVDQLAASGVEEAPGCESCTANRMMLEKVRADAPVL